MRMASSQVDITSSAPFGCVLRDHNRGDRCREGNAHSTFQKNLKNLVRGHFHPCISVSSGCSPPSKKRDKNSNVDSWVADAENNNNRSFRFSGNNRNNNNDSPRQSRTLDRWAAQQAREMVSTIEKHSQEAEVLARSNSSSSASAPSDSSQETSVLGASSLVQIWEKRLNRLNNIKLNSTASPSRSVSEFSNSDSELKLNSTASPSRSVSGLSNNGGELKLNFTASPSRSVSEFSSNGGESPVEEPLSTKGAGDSVHESNDAPPNNDQLVDSEPDKTPPVDAPSSSRDRNSDAEQNEKVRVADIIKKLAAAYQTQTPLTSTSDDNDHGHSSVQASPSLERSSVHEQVENRVFSKVISSPRIRGRQAFADLLMHLERDRHKELETLVERRPVSRFSQKGRIQSMIRLRLLQGCKPTQDQSCLSLAPSEVQRLQKGLVQRSRPTQDQPCRPPAQPEVQRSGPSQDQPCPPPAPAEVLRSRASQDQPRPPPAPPEVNRLPKESLQRSIPTQDQPCPPPAPPEVDRLIQGLAQRSSPTQDQPCPPPAPPEVNRLLQRSRPPQDQPGPPPAPPAVNRLLQRSRPPQDQPCPPPAPPELNRLPQRSRPQQDQPSAPPAPPEVNRLPKGLLQRSKPPQDEPCPPPALPEVNRLAKELLQRSRPTQDQPCPPPAPSEVYRLPKVSAVTHLRDIFSTGAERAATAQNSAASPRSHCRGIVSSIVNLDNSSTSYQPGNHNRNQEASVMEHHSSFQLQSSTSHTMEDDHEESIARPDVTSQRTRLETRSLGSQKSAATTTSLNFWEGNDLAEELEVSDHEYGESSYDWIGDISRPRSYWEDRRQERYDEVLNSSNGEIRRLLERRTVSNFLVSDFKDKMDRLMTSRLGIDMHSEEADGSQGRTGRLVSYLRRHTHLSGSHHQEEEREEEADNEAEEEHEVEEGRVQADEEDDEREEEEEGPVSGPYNEVSTYFDQSSSLLQMPSPPQLWPWTDRDNEASDDSDHVTSPSPSPSPSHHLPSQPYHYDSEQNSSSRNHNSTERELVYDLRGHMEQLHREMSELRQSIKSCMDMQMMLQQSINQEVHSVRSEERKSSDGSAKKRNCCICYEMQVDSLLYRCGHMCTCLKCAHELQWSNGKCPICRAPIMDVVRAYPRS